MKAYGIGLPIRPIISQPHLHIHGGSGVRLDQDLGTLINPKHGLQIFQCIQLWRIQDDHRVALDPWSARTNFSHWNTL